MNDSRKKVEPLYKFNKSIREESYLDIETLKSENVPIEIIVHNEASLEDVIYLLREANNNGIDAIINFHHENDLGENTVSLISSTSDLLKEGSEDELYRQIYGIGKEAYAKKVEEYSTPIIEILLDNNCDIDSNEVTGYKYINHYFKEMADYVESNGSIPSKLSEKINLNLNLIGDKYIRIVNEYENNKDYLSNAYTKNTLKHELERLEVYKKTYSDCREMLEEYGYVSSQKNKTKNV